MVQAYIEGVIFWGEGSGEVASQFPSPLSTRRFARAPRHKLFPRPYRSDENYGPGLLLV